MKVIDFGKLTNRKRIGDFLLVCRSNLGPILHRFRDIAGFLCSSPHPLFHPNFGVFPFDQIVHVGVNVSTIVIVIVVITVFVALFLYCTCPIHSVKIEELLFSW